MARRSLKPHLNQIRTWVRQGRTDAWIAHQLEVTVQQIDAFKRDQGLAPDSGEEPAAAGARAAAAAAGARAATPRRSRGPSTTARRATGSGSTRPWPTTRSTPSTG